MVGRQVGARVAAVRGAPHVVCPVPLAARGVGDLEGEVPDAGQQFDQLRAGGDLLGGQRMVRVARIRVLDPVIAAVCGHSVPCAPACYRSELMDEPGFGDAEMCRRLERRVIEDLDARGQIGHHRVHQDPENLVRDAHASGRAIDARERRGVVDDAGRAVDATGAVDAEFAGHGRPPSEYWPDTFTASLRVLVCFPMLDLSALSRVLRSGGLRRRSLAAGAPRQRAGSSRLLS